MADRHCREPNSGLPADAVATLKMLIGSLNHLEAGIDRLDAEIARRAKENEAARRLMTVPGTGPFIATAIAVLAPPPETFPKALDLAAWPGSTLRDLLDQTPDVSGVLPSRGAEYMTRAVATPPFSTETRRMSFQSTRTAGFGVRTVRSRTAQSRATFISKVVRDGCSGAALMPRAEPK